DLARETGISVNLVMRGQETEIDKFLIERMMDPVLHLVRNAVSHGFEPPAERAAAGKPETGTLVLSAAGVGDSVVLEIADDGRGIDVEAVAGRGRGMDVVRNTVQELNGSLNVETARGEGTRFIIELPLTLSIADALIATVGDRTFAV